VRLGLERVWLTVFSRVMMTNRSKARPGTKDVGETGVTGEPLSAAHAIDTKITNNALKPLGIHENNNIPKSSDKWEKGAPHVKQRRCRDGKSFGGSLVLLASRR
jgi:hypothetical protein